MAEERSYLAEEPGYMAEERGLWRNDFSGHYVLPATAMGSARTSLGPIKEMAYRKNIKPFTLNLQFLPGGNWNPIGSRNYEKSSFPCPTKGFL